MIRILVIMLLLFVGNNCCQAQYSWGNVTSSVYSANRGTAMDQLGNIYVIGTFRATFDADPGPGVVNLTVQGGDDSFLSKYDANGNLVWAKAFGGSWNEKVFSIVADAADNIYIAGTFVGTVDFDPGPGVTTLIGNTGNTYTDITDGFISKFNSSGDFIWVRAFGTANVVSDQTRESVQDLALDDMGNIYALGLFSNSPVDLDPGPAVVSLAPSPTTGRNSFVTVLDGNGNYINGRRVNDGVNKAYPVAIVIKNGTLYIATVGNYGPDSGSSTGIEGNSGFYKFDLGLNLLWNGTMGPDVDVLGMDIDPQGNIVLAGEYYNTSDLNPGLGVYNLTTAPDNYYEMFVTKLDNAGAFQWAKAFPLTNSNLVTVKVNPVNGDIYIGGGTNRQGGYVDATPNPDSYIAPSYSGSGFINVTDGSGNFKALFPILGRGVSLDQGYGGPASLLFDQSANVFVTGSVFKEIDLDPSPVGVALVSSNVTASFFTKWQIRDGIKYYNTKANLGLENLSTWSTTTDGTGPSPQNFSQGDTFNVINQGNASISGVVSLGGLNPRLTIGDGVSPITVTVAAGSTFIAPTTPVNVANNATLILQNNILPSLRIMADGSTVDFAQTGTSSLDSINIPFLRYYNLKLTGGLKNIELGTTTVANNFIADAVVNLGGTKPLPSNPGFCYLECLGDVTFLNGTAFEPESVAASERRFALKMDGPGPVQTITSNGTDIMLVGISRTATALCNIVLSPGTNIYFGSARGGGLFLKPTNTTLSCQGGSINFRNTSILSGYADTGKIISNGTTFNLAGSGQNNNYIQMSGSKQTLKFVPGSTINNLSVSRPIVGNPFYDVVNLNGNIAVTGELSMMSGFLGLPTGSTMSFTNTATLNPLYSGSTSSLIQGAVSKTGASDFYFPLGAYSPYHKFAPVELSNLSSSNTYTVSYHNQDYPNHTVDPATLQANPNYSVSYAEYWDITPAVTGGSADIRFYYTDVNSQVLNPSGVRIAHFDGTDWNDIGGTAGPSNTINAGDIFVAGVSSFSPFTFGGSGLVVPVKLSGFSARKQNKTVQLYWTTEQEINSKFFIIERSADGSKWTDIITKDAAGNSSARLNYVTTDFTPLLGVNYYRLKSIDVNGQITSSEIRSVYFGNGMNVTVFPNPATDNITVNIPGNSKPAHISIYDLQGRLMLATFSANELVEINVAGLAKGIYNIKIVKDGNITESRKVVIK